MSENETEETRFERLRRILDERAAARAEKEAEEKARWEFYKDQLAKSTPRQPQPRKVGGTRGIKRFLGDL